MKHLLKYWICAAFLMLALFAACHKKDISNPVIDPPPPPELPIYDGKYVGLLTTITHNGSIGNPQFYHDTIDYIIEVKNWHGKLILEGDTLQLDSSGHFGKPFYDLIIRNDTMRRMTFVYPTNFNFTGKRE